MAVGELAHIVRVDASFLEPQGEIVVIKALADEFRVAPYARLSFWMYKAAMILPHGVTTSVTLVLLSQLAWTASQDVLENLLDTFPSEQTDSGWTTECAGAVVLLKCDTVVS